MKFVYGREIAVAIAELKPRFVAVAYLGQDWSSYLTDLEALEAIVVSPTIGTSPHAVALLVKALKRQGTSGWDRVHFLDTLHAKLYLGDGGFVAGSANLTANGLAGDRLLEASLLVNDAAALSEAHVFFDEVLRRASQAYPTSESKRLRLSRLFDEQSRAASRDLLEFGTDQRFRSILELGDPLPAFHICWYTAEGPDLKANADDVVGFNICDHLQMHPADHIEAGQWVLTWRLTGRNQLDRRTAPCWMYVDHVEEGLLEDPDEHEGYVYRKAALQRARSATELKALLATAPFHIDAPFTEAMAKALQSHPQLRAGLVQPDADHDQIPWRLDKATENVPLFVQVIQEAIRR